MKTAIELRFICSSREARRELGSVLAPDNAGTPRGLGLSMKSEGRTVTFEMESASPSTALSTTMAILRDVSLFEQVSLLSSADDGWHQEPGRK